MISYKTLFATLVAVLVIATPAAAADDTYDVVMAA
jgi:hypothetical protein